MFGPGANHAQIFVGFVVGLNIANQMYIHDCPCMQN